VIRARLVRLLLRLLSMLPLWLNHGLGVALGRIFNAFANDLRDTARTNVALCFPEWSKAQQRDLVRRCLEETGKAVLESGALWLWSAERVLQRVVQVSGAELLEQGMAAGKGVILAIPHLGAWEVVGVYGSTRWPMTSLYRPPRMQGLDNLMRKARQRAGATLVPTDAGGVRALYKALGRGELVAILPDQDPDRESGVFAPFFGVPANTMTLLPRLVRKTGAMVLMTFAERLPKGRGYHLHFLPAPTGLGDADVVVAATQLNAAVESCARQLPAQYQWAYKRFKTRPESGDKIY
jgi:KDO2-lipid IV(A) lauroyltransferase